MKLSLARIATLVAILSPLFVFCQDRTFTVRDDIAMTRFNEPQFDARDPGGQFASTSPHGRFIAVVTTRGLLDSDLIQSELRIVSSKRSRLAAETAAPISAPRVAATLTSFPHHEETKAYAAIISDLHWSDDDRFLYFKGEDLKGAYRLYRVASAGGTLDVLTPPDLSLGRFDVVGADVFCTLSTPILTELPATTRGNPDAKDVTGLRIHDIIFTNQLGRLVPQSYRLYRLHAGSDKVHRLTLLPGFELKDIPVLSHLFPFLVSRDRRHLILMKPPARLEKGWEQYQPASGLEYLRLKTDGESRILNIDNLARPQQYVVVDLHDGHSAPLLDSLNARSFGYLQNANKAAWSPSGTRVLVTNTFLPITGPTNTSGKENQLPCSILSVDLSSETKQCFSLPEIRAREEWSIQDVRFGRNDTEARVLAKNAKKDQALVTFRLIDAVWHEDKIQVLDQPVRTVAEAERPPDIRLFVKEELNTPPQLWFQSGSTGKVGKLWDPNPQLAQLALGVASPYSWQDSHGRTWNALLFKPVGYQRMQRYPLIIQMYSFTNGQFQTDGLYPSAFAARHLASAGFVVLQIKKKPDTLSEDDPQSHLDAYRSAVEALDRDGLIDRRRVGVVGFSWTCWYTINALIKEPHLFQAATIADGFDNSYNQYMLFAVGAYPIQRQMETIRGTSPIGKGLETWVEDAPGFHLDRVQTPVRIEAHGPSSVLNEWELYAGLQLQKKPVDFIYLPKAQHIVQRPQERLESQQGDVDWFRFWLQGYEDPDPTKREQYVRWEKLKLLHEQIESQHR